MSDTVCPLLWNHSYVSTTNSVKPCCRPLPQHCTDEWNNSIFTQGIESPAHAQARQEMREGKWPKICSLCKISENKFGHSARTIYLENTAGSIDYTKEPTNDDITSLDIKFNNVCNLACVMCNTGSSSQINAFVKDNKHLAPASMGPSINIEWMEQEKLQWCKKIISKGKLQIFKTTGGEPFAQKHFWQLIDWCIENNLTYFEIQITTNGTKFNRPYLEKLIKFKRVQITISCDGTEGVYEYIRHKSNWEKFKNNIKLYKEFVDLYPDKFLTTSFHCVLQAYNCHNILDLYKFATMYEFNFSLDCFIRPTNTVFALTAVPLRIRKKLVKKIQNTEHEELKKYVYVMQKYSHDKFKTKKLYEQTLNLDKARNTDYRSLKLPFDFT